MEKWDIGIYGAPLVGKSAFVFRFLSQNIKPFYDPHMEVSFLKHIECDQEISLLDLNEINSRTCEPYSGLFCQYIQCADACVIMYDFSSYESYRWAGRRMRCVYEFHKQEVPILFFANKFDMGEKKRAVLAREAEEYATEHKALFFEGRARTKEDVQEALEILVRKARKLGKRYGKRTWYVDDIKTQLEEDDPPPPPEYIREVDEPRGLTIKRAK